MTLLALLFEHQLALAFRWSELVGMAGAAVLATAVVWNGRSSRREGALLVAAYVAAVIFFFFVGGR